jgi:hypothetical protein
MHSFNPSTLLASIPLHTTLPPARHASSSSFDELVKIVREYEANEKKAIAEAVAHAIVQPMPLRRSNVMSLAHILCSSPGDVSGQATVEESKLNVYAPSSECTGTEVSSWDEPTGKCFVDGEGNAYQKATASVLRGYGCLPQLL